MAVAVSQLKSSDQTAYIRPDDSGDPRVAVHRRRKSAMVALLGEFERLIEPLLPPGNDEAIATFKGVCRKKINGLAWEAIGAFEAEPGDARNPLAADLAEDFAFDDTEDMNPT